MTKGRIAMVLGVASVSFGLAAFNGASANAAEPAVLILREPIKGSTVEIIDQAPKSKHVFGIPNRLSPGDQLIFTNFLEEGGKRVGKLRAVCIATNAAAFRNLAAAEFVCTALAKLPGGNLVLVGPLSDGGRATEGAVVGGTGKYAGAEGTFVVEEGRSSDTNTVTLLE